MADNRRSRQANGRSSIYLGNDGRWHGRVSVGVRDDGRPDRRHVSAKTKSAVTAKVRHIEAGHEAASLPSAGQRWTVDAWLRHWVEDIAASSVKVNTLAGYRVAVYHHLLPGIGHHRLISLTPEHLEALHQRILKTPTKTGGPTRPARNPTLAARAPRIDHEEVHPFTVDQIQRIFATALQKRNGPRWVVALALGLRQGEALGLQWADVDLDRRTLTIKRNRLRPRYRHGCNGTCGRAHAGYCPQRIPDRPDTDSTKSSAGRRVVGLPAPLCLLTDHRQPQGSERAAACNLWHEGDWVFATEAGQPINPRTDWSHWKKLLVEAGIRDSRLHDARHTAATVLVLLGVKETTIMSVMGWSNPAVTQRYAHMVSPIRDDVAAKLASLLWTQDQPAKTPNETKTETRGRRPVGSIGS